MAGKEYHEVLIWHTPEWMIGEEESRELEYFQRGFYGSEMRTTPGALAVIGGAPGISMK